MLLTITQSLQDLYLQNIETVFKTLHIPYTIQSIGRDRSVVTVKGSVNTIQLAEDIIKRIIA